MPWLWGVLRLAFRDGAGGGRHVPIWHVLHGPIWDPQSQESLQCAPQLLVVVGVEGLLGSPG